MKKTLALLLVLLISCAGPGPTPVPSAVQTPGPTDTRIPTLAPPPPSATPQPSATPAIAITEEDFAEYRLQPVSTTPSLRQEPIDPRMGNVLVSLALSPEQLERLGAGVVASPQDYPEFHNLYQETMAANLPLFVTSDSLLHAYHLIFDAILLQLEEQVFLPHLQELNRALLVESEAEYEQLKGSDWEDAARRVLAYVAVGSKLADPHFQVPDAVMDLANAELALINAASGPNPSPIFPLLPYGEDYSQYVPRGHYTKSEQLTAYFKAMMWYGRMTFRLGDPDAPDVGPTETRMALLLTLAVRDGGSGRAVALWEELYDPTAFLVGRSDDLTYHEYLAVMDSVYGPGADLATIADDANLEAFIAAADELPAPRILGLISDDYKPLESVKGLRLMGQRFVPDAYIFQELIHPKVPDRLLPSGLDVMAVMGSERATTWLTQDETTQNPKYAAQTDQLMDWIEGLTQAEWVETAYNGWLYTLRPLLTPSGEGYPLFMQSTAWQDKQLNTALGSWAELKHDTLLYAKQPYGGLGGCGWPAPPAPELAQNYVEPVPEVFARLAALATMTRAGLEQRGLFTGLPADEYGSDVGEFMSGHLEDLSSQALALKAMSEKELRGQPLTEAEQGQLRGIGNYLQGVAEWANGTQEELDPAAIIADVATDPNTGRVLEVGIGNVHEIYVVAPIPQADGSLGLTVARGGVFSYYEFRSGERLTDETWRARVKSGQAPDQPAFTGGFSVPQAADLDIQAAIYRFQRDWANWLYLTIGYDGTQGQGCSVTPTFFVPVSSGVQQQAEAAVAALREQNQFEGRKWISSDYLSVEPVSSSVVNVTVRETWTDFLATYPGDNPFAWWDRGEPEPITARRGPYEMDVTYVLQRLPSETGYQWRVVSFTELTERPTWERP